MSVQGGSGTSSGRGVWKRFRKERGNGEEKQTNWNAEVGEKNKKRLAGRMFVLKKEKYYVNSLWKNHSERIEVLFKDL